jgi:hypothetical protein
MSRARKSRKNARSKRRSEPRRWSWKTGLDPTRYALIAVLVGVAAYRLAMLSDQAAPPGADPGNWLAFTHELFGTPVKAAESTYFPVTLVVLRGLLAFLPELMAAKVLGVGASVLMGIPFYLILRRGCSPILAAALTLAFLVAPYQNETLAFGGYPQLLATTFLLFTIYWLGDGLISGRRRSLLLAAGSAALLAGTHHFMLILAVPTLLVFAVMLLLLQRASLRAFLRNAGVWMGAAALFALVFLPWYIGFLSLLDGNPANPNGFSRTDVWGVFDYIFGEQRFLWTGLLVLALASMLLPFRGRRADEIRPAATGLMLGSLVVFAVTSEVRSFQLVEAGVVLSLGVLVALAEEHLSETEVRVAARRLARVTLGMALASLLIIVVGGGQQRLSEARTVYQVVDDSALEALEWLRESSPPGAVVVANESPYRVSYAWWVEGFAERPTYSLIKPEFLSFGEEKEQSALATRLLERETSPEEVEDILEETGIEYIFVDKRTGGRFRPLLSKTMFYLSFENDSFGILRYPQARAEAAP